MTAITTKKQVELDAVTGYRCNRCGAAISLSNVGAAADPAIVNHAPEGGMTVDFTGGYAAYLDGVLDGELCHDCMDSLAAWMCEKGGQFRLYRGSRLEADDAWPPQEKP